MGERPQLHDREGRLGAAREGNGAAEGELECMRLSRVIRVVLGVRLVAVGLRQSQL